MKSVYAPGDKVELTILRESDLGFVALINKTDEGLIYHDEIFKHIEVKQELYGYIKKIRRDGGIDLLLENFGHLGAEDLGDHLLKALEKRGGHLPINAKSPAEDIYDLFGVSRKKFKMALGSLYKKRLVRFTESGTELINDEDKSQH